MIVAQQRRVHYSSDPIAGIAAPYGNFAIHHADAGHAAPGIIRILRAGRGNQSSEAQHCTRDGPIPQFPFVSHGRSPELHPGKSTGIAKRQLFYL
jgi:hypothetical protein